MSRVANTGGLRNQRIPSASQELVPEPPSSGAGSSQLHLDGALRMFLSVRLIQDRTRSKNGDSIHMVAFVI